MMIIIMLIIIRDHSFSMYATFSEKLTFLAYVFVSGVKKC